jgi:hypothetical protein
MLLYIVCVNHVGCGSLRDNWLGSVSKRLFANEIRLNQNNIQYPIGWIDNHKGTKTVQY